MKILHIGNVANNAYKCVKILREVGIEADMCNAGYTHAMGHPEWEDADYQGEAAEFSPDWSKVDLKGFTRPSWFMQDVVSDVPVTMRKRITTKMMPFAWFRRFITKYHTPLYGLSKKLFPEKLPKDLADRAKNLVKAFKEYFPDRRDCLSVSDVSFYYGAAKKYSSLFQSYDLIQAYGSFPTYVLLVHGRPDVAFEHGTLRDMPFEDNARGRLLALAYRMADHVIITNPDVLPSVKRLGITQYSFLPHPIDEGAYIPFQTPLRKELENTTGAQCVFFCPLRHDWGIKGTDKHIRAFAKFCNQSSKKSILILSEWGMEVARSKDLVTSLGIVSNVQWIKPAPKMRLRHYYNAADIVLDQMIYPTFGTTAPEAMACGKPVIISYNHSAASWCFPQPPPLVSAFTEEEVYEKMVQLMKDNVSRIEIGKKGREWIMKYHSRAVVREGLCAIYKKILNGKKI